MTVKVFVVEDHPFMRESLVEFLTTIGGFEVTGTSGSVQEALDRLAEAEVDLVLVDVSLADGNGIELVRLLRRQRPELVCLMLSGHREQNYVRQSLEAGARGFVLKGNPAELPEAIRTAMAGGVYLSAAAR